MQNKILGVRLNEKSFLRYAFAYEIYKQMGIDAQYPKGKFK